MSTSSTARLVASVVAPTNDAMLELAHSGTEGADLVELRVDALREPPDLERLRERTELPAILTCRRVQEGGAFRGTEDDRLAILQRAIALGFAYVDFELRATRGPVEPSSSSSRILLSVHDLEGMLASPESHVEKALERGAQAIKIAARVGSLDQTMRLARAGTLARERGIEYTAVPLGPGGAAGRVLASRLGSSFMYTFARGGSIAGPGQISIDELLDRYRFRSLSAKTAIYGIVGSHASESLSPAMHNAFFAEHGIDAVYVSFQQESLGSFMEDARAFGVRGLSVTNPFKEQTFEYLDEGKNIVDGDAAAVGAANTLVLEGDVWNGLNTDVDGVRRPLERRGDLREQRAVVLGAGGAARAAVAAAKGLGMRTTVLARRREQSVELAKSLGCEAGTLNELSGLEFDVLIHATPVGSSAQPGVIVTLPADSMSGKIIFDMVSLPEETELIRAARAAGATTITGLEMLGEQAVGQAKLWTGIDADAGTFTETARRASRPETLSRYSRQILFKEIGEEGQRRLRTTSVLVVGAGALGSVSSEMLVRAGVGMLRLVDRDYVDETNLQRQSLYDEDDLARSLPKAVAAREKLARMNSDVRIDARVEDMHPGNVRQLLEDIDLVLDGTDNFETRYLLNDACLEKGTPWIYAAAVGSYGMSFVILPGESACLRCLVDEQPPPGASPSCDTAGILAPAVHAVASFQVGEALKILSGRRESLLGSLLSLDVWTGTFERFRAKGPRAGCLACQRRQFDYLSGEEQKLAVTLCGRNAVQVRPARTETLPLGDIAARLGPLGDVRSNAHLLRFKTGENELVLFRDGRAIVHGTSDPAVARSLYARYVGS